MHLHGSRWKGFADCLKINKLTKREDKNMNAKHTPGKLYFKPTASDCQGVIYGETGSDIAIIYDRNDGYGELFAAAPELLKTLREILIDYSVLLRQHGMNPEFISGFEEAESLISKAEGK
jgi:hypothetical protein